MPARPKPPTPLPLTTQAPWRSGRGGASKDQAATARDLRRACKALGLRVTSERQTPAGTAARAQKVALLTAAHAAAESLHVATAHAAPIAPEALALSPAALWAREKTRRRPVAAPLCLPKVVASLATQARW